MSSSNRSSRAVRVAVVATAALAAALGTASALPAQAKPQSPHQLEHLDVAKGLTFTPSAQSNRPVTVMLQMQGAPVAQRDASQQLSRKAENGVHDDLKSQQDKIKGRIGQAGGTVVAQLQWAYNGLQVQTREKDVAALASLPGVVAVHKMPTFKPANVNGVPYVGGPQTWQDTGNTGKGVKIADIDTGIDYTHADFGGPGTVASYDAADKTDTAPADPALFGPRAPKVKGGYDLVGDDYDANVATSVPKPDPNPLDCNGHGSHTAGTAAGYGVTDDGKQYQGPYTGDTISSHQWNVGPGVAPEADIYAYRVFGCEGSSNVVAEAIDMAVRDHVDVINMSLGSDFGGVDDPTTVAAENAAKAGITVVAAAGNAGNNAYMVSSPSTGNDVLSVAALDGSRKDYPGARLSLSTGKTVDTIDANGAPLPSGSFPVKVLRDTSGGVSLGCDPAEYAGTKGMVVVTKRGTCARAARAVFGQRAGAAAVVMINSDQTLPPFEGKITENPDNGDKENVTIPFLGAAGTAENTAALIDADGKTTTLSDITVPNTTYRHTASFSSGGPRNADSGPKPEVIAPGVSVSSAGVGTGNGPLVESGTSMATPMTAGTAALVKQAHPTWGSQQVKAAIQNTGDPSLNTGYQVRLAGTGEVQAQRATTTNVLATTTDGLNSLAFGYVPGSGSYTATKSFQLTNTGSRSATYDLGVETNGNQRGASVSVSPSSVTVAPGATKTVDVKLDIPAGAFTALPSDDTNAVGPGQVTSVGGVITATPQNAAPGQLSLRTEYLVVPRGLSDVRPGTPAKYRPAGDGSFTSSLPLKNQGIHEGTADVYAWGISDPADTGDRSMDVRAAGVQSFADGASDRDLVFAVDNWGPATNQSTDEFDVAIDSDQDGTTDYFVVGADLGAVTAGVADGRFASFTIDARTHKIIDAFLADAPMNGSVVELPALASEIGVTSAKPSFDYTVTGFTPLDSALVDPTGTASFDAFAPAVNTGQFADLQPGASGSVPLTVDRSKQRSTKGVLGWLVVSTDDAGGAAQADEVEAPSNLGH
jgi:subtilisin family serine protease